MADEEERRDDCSSLINIKSFKEQLLMELSITDLERKTYEMSYSKLTEEMGISTETVAELDDVCSPSNLKSPNEPDDLDSVDIYNYDIPEEVELSSLRILKNRRGKFTHLKREINYVIKETRVSDSTPTSKVPVDKVAIVLSVAIHHPTMLKKVQEFLVLSDQTLSCLRDKIYCVSDNIVPGDYSEKPDLSLTEPCKDICKSGFFYIENVFYNDMRDSLCRDYSRVITEWAKDNSKLSNIALYCNAKVAGATRKRMEEVTFEELTIRLGYPYLYCHQGNCEHIIIFTDLRLLDIDDGDNALDYPKQIFRHRSRRRQCRVCNIFTAVWITKNDIMASEDPCFFCDKCFKALHYTADKQKLCDFEAYPYMGYSNW